MSTSYHFKTDGSSEQTNKAVNQAIRWHADNNQKGWPAKHPHVQFTIMNTINASTWLSGFQLKTGRSPLIIPPIVPLAQNATAEQITAHDIITCVNLNVWEAQDNLTTKIFQAYHANEHWVPVNVYKVGDLTLLQL
jgi:hypothetical protein